MMEGEKGMRIFYCGREECERGHFFGPAVRTHYLLHFVLKGKGSYRTEYGEYEVKEGEVFLIRPDEVTYYRADIEEPWSYAWIAFDGNEAAGLIEKYYPNRRNPVCIIEEVSEVSRCFEGLLNAFGSAKENREKVLGYFYLIIACLLQTGNKGELTDEEGYYKRALSFIRHNFGYPIQVSQIADYVGIDRTYLYRIFMHHEGESPKQYLSRYRLSEAKEMLYNTEYKVTEIAYSCGYHDSSAFCRHFQREVGMAPLEYRYQRKYAKGSKNLDEQKEKVTVFSSNPST